MLERLKSMLWRRFGKLLAPSDRELTEARHDAHRYGDNSDTNITAIFANALTTLALSDSDISVTGDTKRAEALSEILQRHTAELKRHIAAGNGTGMIVSLPYSVSGGLGRKIYIDTVTKDRVFVTGIQGDEITSLTVLADMREVRNRRYYRWTNYMIENGTYTITQFATQEEAPCELSAVADWANITPEIHIGGVKKLPVGIYRCPAGNRRPSTVAGVPITYGCERTMQRIRDTLRQIDEEYKGKRTMIFADETMFDKAGSISSNIFRVVDGGQLGGKPFFEVFSPEFRDTSLYNKLEHLFALCEKEVGTSRGILTDLNTSGATATEIKRATYSTFALCDDIHSNIERYITDLLYGVNILENFYGLTPEGEYEIKFDWSYSMLEDTQTSFNQLLSAKHEGAASAAEVRQFIYPEETPQRAQERVDEIRETEPTMSQLIGD